MGAIYYPPLRGHAHFMATSCPLHGQLPRGFQGVSPWADSMQKFGPAECHFTPGLGSGSQKSYLVKLSLPVGLIPTVLELYSPYLVSLTSASEPRLPVLKRQFGRSDPHPKRTRVDSNAGSSKGPALLGCESEVVDLSDAALGIPDGVPFDAHSQSAP